MRVVFFGTYDVKATPRVQVLMDGLREHGITVVTCNVPLPMATAEKVSILKNPWKLPILGVKILFCWIRLISRRVRLSSFDAVIVGHMGQFDIHLARLLFRKTPLILDYLVSGAEAAQDRRLSNNWKNRLLLWLDSQALRVADQVLVDTEEHRQQLPKRFINKGLVVLVGAPNTWFQVPERSAKNKHEAVKIIFFGLYTPLQGAPVIAEALVRLHSRRKIEVTMVGKGQDEILVKKIASTSSVKLTWLDWVDASDLPKLVAMHDICLGIFGTGPKSLAVVPNKIYQGAAVGCALITSNTHPQASILGGAASFVPPGDSDVLAKTIQQLADDSSLLSRQQSSAYKLARESFTPEKVVLPLSEYLATIL